MSLNRNINQPTVNALASRSRKTRVDLIAAMFAKEDERKLKKKKAVTRPRVKEKAA